MRVVFLQQGQPLLLLQRQQLTEPPTYPCGLIHLRRASRGELATDLFEDAFQQQAQQPVLRLQFIVGVRLAPLHLANHQTVVAHPAVLHLEAAGTAQAQLQHAVAAHVEVLQQCLHAPGRRHGRLADFTALQDQAHAEGSAAPATLAHHVQVAGLEHAQAHCRTRQQRRVQQEQRQVLRCSHRLRDSPGSVGW